MKRELANIVKRVYEVVFGESPRTTDCDSLKSQGIRCVTAGDPAQAVGYINADDIDLPDSVRFDGKNISPREYDLFLVEGTSMVPRDVWSGDILACKPVGELSTGRYVIVTVDRDYYTWKQKDVLYDFKLRHVLTEVSIDTNVESVISELNKTNPDICLDENQKCLKEKFNEIHRYLSERTHNYKELTVSETFRNGQLRYSFHPKDLICYRAAFILRRSSNGWKTVKLEKE